MTRPAQWCIGWCLFSAALNFVARFVEDYPVWQGLLYVAWSLPLIWMLKAIFIQRRPACSNREWFQMYKLGYRYRWMWKQFYNKEGAQDVAQQADGWTYGEWVKRGDGILYRITANAASPLAAHVMGKINAMQNQPWAGDL
jgi:hypothetical protein